MCEAKFTPSKGWLMARTAMQMPRQVQAVEFGALAHAAAAPFRAARPFGAMIFGGDPTATAVAFSGLGALVLLPVLLLLSAVLSAPLAVPAVIALGYLATSYALATENRRGAAAINAVVLVGLVGWSLGALLVGEEISRAGLAAALLAPLFAATPALARLALAPRRDGAARAAIKNTECLDKLAPGEAVLVVRRDGTLLAATGRARTMLCLSAGMVGRDVARGFALVDRPRLTDAIARCGADTPIAVAMQETHAGDAPGSTFTAEVSAMEAGAVSIRLVSAPARDESVTVSHAADADNGAPERQRDTLSSDIPEAVSFALQRAAADAGAKGVDLTADVRSGIAARCERQVCRRIAFLMIESMLAGSRPGDALHLTGRVLRTVVLLQLVRTAGEGNDADAEGSPDIGALAQLLDDVGGTAVAEKTADGARLSVRLQLAPPHDPSQGL